MPKRVLGINLEQPPYINEGEEQVAELGSDPRGIAGDHGLVGLPQFLAHLVPCLPPRGPIESDAPGLHLQPLRSHERWKALGDAVERRPRTPVAVTLGPLDPLPLVQGLAGIGHLGVREDMRMPAGHLPENPLQDLCHGELALLLGYLAVEDHLEENVSQLFDDVVGPALAEGLERFIGFFDEVGLEGGARLLAIPRATSFTP